MYFMYYAVVILVLTKSSDSVKMNMVGSVSLGKEVIETFTDILGNSRINGRRSMMSPVEEDVITAHVRTAALCRDIPFCINLRKFTEEYIIVLAKSIQAVLSGILEDNFKMFIFEGQLKIYLELIRHILERADAKISNEKDTYYWIDTMKKIAMKFQEMASIFISEELELDPEKINKLKKELNQKLIIAIVLVEMKYQTILCIEHYVCVKSVEVTKSLNALLVKFKTMTDEKVKLFIRYFYEALFDTAFYSHIDEATAHELQVILNDMAYSADVPTKDVLLTVQDIVEARLESIESNTEEKLAHDALLIHGILSDMDHIYGIRKSGRFGNFLQKFLSWIKFPDFRIDKQIRLVMQDIAQELSNVTEDLLLKLINEVKVFIELTVESEKAKNL